MLLCLSGFERHVDVFCIEFVPVMHVDIKLDCCITTPFAVCANVTRSLSHFLFVLQETSEHSGGTKAALTDLVLHTCDVTDSSNREESLRGESGTNISMQVAYKMATL